MKWKKDFPADFSKTAHSNANGIMRAYAVFMHTPFGWFNDDAKKPTCTQSIDWSFLSFFSLFSKHVQLADHYIIIIVASKRNNQLNRMYAYSYGFEFVTRACSEKVRSIGQMVSMTRNESESVSLTIEIRFTVHVSGCMRRMHENIKTNWCLVCGAVGYGTTHTNTLVDTTIL